MKTLSTAVLGGGMAGLSAALALSRAGHRVALAAMAAAVRDQAT